MAAVPQDDPVVERLTELLGYVEQVIRLDERPAFRLSEYRLPTGQTFIFHQQDFHALPGIEYDLTDEDGPIWLSMQRIKRGEPPEPSDDLAPWLNLSPDPNKQPTLREFVTRTVSESEKDDLLARGQARPEDCTGAMGPQAKGRFDVTLRLEDRPEITSAAQQYISTEWLPWAEAERPKRKSISLYQRLFEVAQLAELWGAEQPIELVWGIGLTPMRSVKRERCAFNLHLFIGSKIRGRQSKIAVEFLFRLRPLDQSQFLRAAQRYCCGGC